MAVVDRQAPRVSSRAVPPPRPGAGHPAPRSAAGRPPVRALLRSLEQLLDLVLAGRAVFGPGENGVVIDVTLGGYRWIAVQQEVRAEEVSLSPREAEIARMVAAGLTNKAIASVLDISPWTVGTYLRRIFGKLEVNSRAAMTAAVARSRYGRPDAGGEQWTADE